MVYPLGVAAVLSAITESADFQYSHLYSMKSIHFDGSSQKKKIALIYRQRHLDM